MHSRTTWSWAAVAGLTLVVACKLAPHLTGPNSGQLAQIVVSPDSVALDPQQTQQFQAFGRTAAGDSVGATVTWSASAGTITASGMYTADTSAADVVVTASVSADQLSGIGHVKKKRLVQILVSPASVTLREGAAQQFSAFGRKNTGDSVSVSVNYTATGGAITPNGLYTAGQAPGNFRVMAKQNGGALADSSTVTVTTVPVASVTVSPPSASIATGATVQLTATTKDAGGNVLTGRAISWGGSNTTVASVSASGLITGVTAGAVTITATSEGQSGTATVTVVASVPVPVASVTVSPALASIATGATVQLAATTRDAGGNVLTGRVISWGSSNTTVATVSGSGLVTGVRAGAVTITATSEGKNGTAAVTVAAPPPPAGCGNTSPGVCYYVATSGNDANPGTAAQPFATIQHAADIVNPGDGVLVGDGVYTGGATIVTISRSGTATNRIVFRAAHRWLAVIDGQNNLSTTGIAIPGGYIRVEGFEVRNTNRYGIDTYLGHDQTVVGNHVHDIGHICTGSTGGIVAIDAYAPNLVIEGNLIHDIGRLGPGENGCTPPNDYWQNHDHGIYNGIGTNVVIRNNVFYNLKHGWAIQRYDGGGTVVDGLYIENNTFAGANPNRDAQIIIATTTTNLVIANNIFYQPATAGVWFSGAGTGATLTGNVSTGALQIGGSGLATSLNLENTDPLFTNAAGFDFHLTTGSPARGAGVTAWCPLTDFDGVTRVAPCSAGAFQ